MYHDSIITPVATVQRRQKPRLFVRKHYKLDEVASFIRGELSTSGVKPTLFYRVALQFPDNLLEDAVAVTETLKDILNENNADRLNCGADGVGNVKETTGTKETEDKKIHLFVLADNTFGSCCPDEITAQHYGSDCIIHFGDACMSRSTRIPVFYVQDDFRFSVVSCFPAEERELSVRVVLRAATILKNHLKGLRQSLEEKHIHANVTLVIVGSHRSRGFVEAACHRWWEEHRDAVVADGDVIVEWCNFDSLGKAVTDASDVSSVYSGSSLWVINGVSFPRADPITLQRFLFIGPSDSLIPLHLLNVHQYNLFHHSEELRDAVFDSHHHPAVLTVLDESFTLSGEMGLEVGSGCDSNNSNNNNSNNGNNATTNNNNVKMMDTALEAHLIKNNNNNFTAFNTALGKRMQQRAFNIELIRSSTAVGIVVTSLAIEGYYETTMLLHRLLRAYKKRAYIIYIGHLNEYKIANFVDTVDCFVAIACPNSREGHFPTKNDGFLKPIVSPVDVVLALRGEDGNSSLFGHPAVYSTTFDCILPLLRETLQAVRGEGEEENMPMTMISQGGSDSVSLIRTCPGVVTKQSSSGALARLHQRHFVGLDPRKGQTPVQEEIVEGRHGIARGYASERRQQEKEQ